MKVQKREDDEIWVIPSLDVRLPQAHYTSYSTPIRYWMVELKLTSDEVLNFYVKAKTHQDALKKAEDMISLAEIGYLKKKEFILIN